MNVETADKDITLRAAVSRRVLRGFTLFELMIVTCVVGIASLFFFERVLFYQEMAEKTAVELTVMHLKNGVRYKMVELLLHQQDKEIIGLEGKNPMQWVDYPPPGYIGELKHPQWDQIAPGSWYFDVDKCEIVYRVRRGRHFVSGTGDRQMLRYRVTAISKRSTADPSITLAGGVTMTPLEKYTWF